MNRKKNIRKKIISCLCVAALCTNCTGVVSALETDKNNEIIYVLETGGVEELQVVGYPAIGVSSISVTATSTIQQTRGTTLDGTELSDDFYYYRNSLSTTYKKAYDEIHAALLKGTKQINLKTSVSASDISTVYLAVLNDCPELFWCDASFSYSYNSFNKVIYILPSYNDLLENQESVQSQLDDTLNSAFSVMSTLDSDIEVVKYAHDYLVHTINYNTDSSYNQNIYSAIVNGETVCAGYTRAFQYIMQKMGIPCTYITGTVNGGNHAWNILKLDGEYYAMDVTWDDPVLKDYEGNIYYNSNFYRYNYFNITDEELAEDGHTRGEISEIVPVATGTKYSYKNYYSGNAVGTDFSAKGMVVQGLASDSYANGITLLWDKVDDAEGYIIYSYQNGEYTEIGETLSTSYICYELNNNADYTFAVKSYKTAGEERIYSGKYTTITATTNGSEYIYAPTEEQTTEAVTTEVATTETTTEMPTTLEVTTTEIPTTQQVTTTEIPAAEITTETPTTQQVTTVEKTTTTKVTTPETTTTKATTPETTTPQKSTPEISTTEIFTTPERTTDTATTTIDKGTTDTATTTLAEDTGKSTTTASVETVTKVGKVKIKTVKIKKKSVYLVWKKVKKADKYEIQCSKNKKFTKGVKSKKTKKVKWTITGLKKNKTYYIRIRAYKKNVYGLWSKREKVIIK